MGAEATPGARFVYTGDRYACAHSTVSMMAYILSKIRSKSPSPAYFAFHSSKEACCVHQGCLVPCSFSSTTKECCFQYIVSTTLFKCQQFFHGSKCTSVKLKLYFHGSKVLFEEKLRPLDRSTVVWFHSMRCTVFITPLEIRPRFGTWSKSTLGGTVYCSKWNHAMGSFKCCTLP